MEPFFFFFFTKKTKQNKTKQFMLILMNEASTYHFIGETNYYCFNIFSKYIVCIIIIFKNF